MRSKQKGLSRKTRKLKSKRIRIGILVAFVVFAIAVVATIAVPRNSSQAKPKKFKATREIVFDQTTGQRRKPTPAETETMLAQLRKLTNRSTEGLVVHQTGNGEMMDLEGRFGGVVLGRARADGTTEVKCVFTLEEAVEFLGLEEVE